MSLSRWALVFLLALAASKARAQAPPADAQAAPATVSAAEASPILLTGYAEAYWQWNFDRPSNGMTNYRGFDNRDDSFTVSNVVLDARWDSHDVIGRVALQVGHTPSTYYLAEPTSEGTPGANRSDAALWKYVQQANVGYRFHPWQRDLTVLAGIFLSPIGPESMAVHDNWTWSRSNLFFGLPFYHAGARATLALSTRWSLTAAVYNGWNNIVDNNRQKSLSLQTVYTPHPQLSWSLLYFGGVERARAAVEGSAFRHLFDSHVTWYVQKRLALMAHANTGFEPNHFGSTYWGGGALSTRVVLLPQLSLATRADVLAEHAARDREGVATRLFFPARWVSSATATLDYHPAETVSFRLEYRHDAAASVLYYRGRVASDQTPNARRMNTLTLGLTAWF